MRNRESMQRKIDVLESTLINLQRIAQTREPLETYTKTIRKGLDIIDDLKSIIESEPLSPNEINRF
jgi:hypothetical protein